MDLVEKVHRVLIFLADDGQCKAISEGAGYRWSIILADINIFSGTGNAIYSFWLSGAEHVYRGRCDMGPIVIDSDSSYPLTFKLIRGRGLVYMCGRGTVTRENGVTVRFGYEDTIYTWLPRLSSRIVIDREAATQALGWLAISSEEKEIVIPSLLTALEDPVWQVRRNAAESLGRIQGSLGSGGTACPYHF